MIIHAEECDNFESELIQIGAKLTMLSIRDGKLQRLNRQN